VEQWFTSTHKKRIEKRQQFELQAIKEADQQQSNTHDIDTSDILPIPSYMDTNVHSGISLVESLPPGYAPSIQPRKNYNVYILIIMLFAMFAGGAFLVHLLFKKEEHIVIVNQGGSGDKTSDNLFIKSNPAGANIFLDGKLVGVTAKHGVTLWVDPGKEHTVLLRADKYKDYVVSFMAETSGRRQINAELIPLAPGEKNRRRAASYHHSRRKHREANRSNQGESEERPALDEDQKETDPTTIKQEILAEIRALSNAPSTASPADAATEKQKQESEKQSPSEDKKVSTVSELVTPPPKPKPEKISLKITEPVPQSQAALMKRRIAGKDVTFPRMSYRRIEHAAVKVMVFVNKEGTITRTDFKTGDRDFKKAVARALRTWRFRPYQIDGQPVSTVSTLVFKFRME